MHAMASQQYNHLVKTSTLFFQPIYSKSLPDKLMIPRKFVNKHGDGLSDTVILKLPSSEEWKVNLGRRNNGDVWFENGWKEFAEYHSLLKGRLLVFGFDDSTPHHLNVMILDLTTSEEIDYPSNPDVHAVTQQVRFSSKDLKVKGEEDIEGNRARALERATSFKSQSQYPSFLIVAGPGYINTSCQVYIPSKFAIKFLSSKKSGQRINLRTSNGRRVWVSNIGSREVGSRTRYELSHSGWKEFVKDNDLKVDDVCVFELINGAVHHELNFMVSIFRNKNPSDVHLSQGNHTKKNKSVQVKTEAQEFEDCPKKPKFTEAASPAVLVMDLTTSEEIIYPSNHGGQGEQQGESPCETRKKDRNLKRGHIVQTTLNLKDAHLYNISKKCKDEEDIMRNQSRALERAKTFKSQSQYPSFIIVARPSYINASSQLAIPSEFARKCLSSKNSGEIANLRTSNGRRKWVANVGSRKRGTRTMFDLSRSGWKDFVKDNDLKVDDVCVFELINGGVHHELNFMVSIFRNNNPSDVHLSQETGKLTKKKKWVKIKTEAQEFEDYPKKPKFAEAASSRKAAVHSFNSENIFFKVTIGLSHGQAIPASFVRKYCEQGKHVVKLMVRDRSWRVQLIRGCKFSFQEDGLHL